MFPFNQPEKTKDCGYRCLYHVINPLVPYEDWLNLFRFFNPKKQGINFSDICEILSYYKIDHCFSQLESKGLYIIYSGIWLYSEGLKHGHYFLYEDEVVYCSTHSEPYKFPLAEAVKRLEAKTVDHAFRCLRITK